MSDARWTAITAWEAEGARVGISTCRECGASILIDPRDTEQWQTIHDQWHGGESR